MATMTATMSSPAQAQTQHAFKPVDHSANPPPEKFHTIDGLIRSHAAEPDQPPLICYPRSSVEDFEEWSAEALDRFTDAAVARFMKQGLAPAVSSLNPIWISV